MNGLKSGQKGFNKNKMMLLFTAHTAEKSGKNKYGGSIEIRKALASDRFNNQYSISGAIAVGDWDGEIISRKPATIISIILEKMTISNGNFFHTYDISDKNKPFEIKVNN